MPYILIVLTYYVPISDFGSIMHRCGVRNGEKVSQWREDWTKHPTS